MSSKPFRDSDSGAPASIAIVVGTLAVPGGAERVAARLAAEWHERGTHVTILTFDPPDTPRFFRIPPAVEVRGLALTAVSRGVADALVNNIRRLRVLRRAVRDSGASVVISFVDVMNVLTVFATTGLRLTVIAAERTAPAHAPIGRVWTLLRNIAYRLADGVVVQSQGAASHFRRSVGGKLHVIPNPVEKVEKEGRRSGGQVTAIGRFTREKGFDLLIRAFGHASAFRPGWTLTIWGDGPLREQLETVVGEEGLAGRVQLPGITTTPDEHLLATDIFVLSSLYEGFPNVLCEAMAAGAACIATDCPDGPREIVRDGVDGLLVSPEDEPTLVRALGRLMDDEGERLRFGRAAREISDRFSPDAVLARWNLAIERARQRDGRRRAR
jgi:GalNAc-alpha-(1->4)-GalNAc-alpha-(1->3)-diNAcBac-PP-undecaprenol alpha-1,4-N-acetyl-D-galactosaminyltransferase